ncbi:hypothetical protein CAOG_003666 [Capsaspora owczarzaki ATCC 30864]|uniref:DUF4460 domain-containing protein n=2 Tax=Capsaspora owczarzaki (strain ATCC 30864) TaxID=595528 RepID=A0A0D2X2L3_CAPO3|nr:hypothetical protein CAOG_003666 [Capsaspora owczarzaki ATCC 30864]
MRAAYTQCLATAVQECIATRTRAFSCIGTVALSPSSSSSSSTGSSSGAGARTKRATGAGSAWKNRYAASAAAAAEAAAGNQAQSTASHANANRRPERAGDGTSQAPPRDVQVQFKEFLLKVHPDRFGAVPQVQSLNQASLQEVNAHLQACEDAARVETLPTSVRVAFYVADTTAGSASTETQIAGHREISGLLTKPTADIVMRTSGVPHVQYYGVSAAERGKLRRKVAMQLFLDSMLPAAKSVSGSSRAQQQQQQQQHSTQRKAQSGSHPLKHASTSFSFDPQTNTKTWRGDAATQEDDMYDFAAMIRTQAGGLRAQLASLGSRGPENDAKQATSILNAVKRNSPTTTMDDAMDRTFSRWMERNGSRLKR